MTIQQITWTSGKKTDADYKSDSGTFDRSKLPQEAIDFCLEYGFRQILQDAAAIMATEGKNNADRVKIKRKKTEAKYDDLCAGILRRSRTSLPDDIKFMLNAACKAIAKAKGISVKVWKEAHPNNWEELAQNVVDNNEKTFKAMWQLELKQRQEQADVSRINIKL